MGFRLFLPSVFCDSMQARFAQCPVRGYGKGGEKIFSPGINTLSLCFRSKTWVTKMNDETTQTARV
jgi:hypothetical protein